MLTWFTWIFQLICFDSVWRWSVIHGINQYTGCIRESLRSRYQNALISGKIPMAPREGISQRELYSGFLFMCGVLDRTNNVTKPLQVKLGMKKLKQIKSSLNLHIIEKSICFNIGRCSVVNLETKVIEDHCLNRNSQCCVRSNWIIQCL